MMTKPSGSMETFVEAYVSDDEWTPTFNSRDRRQKRVRCWEKVATFDGKVEAMRAIESEGIWSYHYLNRTRHGNKVHYRCNAAKKRSQQCSAGLYLFYDNRNSDVVRFQAKEEHSHRELLDESVRLSERIKDQIKELFELRVKPKRIFEILVRKGFTLKNKGQLANYLVRLRKQSYGSTEISLGELEQWCSDRSRVPQSADSAYVVACRIHHDEDDAGCRPQFGVFVSTDRLLEIVTRSKNVHVDATYKLVWEGMPVIVVGSTDADRHFHPAGIAVCSDDKTVDYKFVLESLVAGVGKAGRPYDPDYLVSDACRSVRDAFVGVFGADKVLVTCWAHVRRNLAKKIESLVRKSLRGEAMGDIDALHLSSGEEIFRKAASLFVDKWSRRGQLEFVEHMNSQWLTTHDTWYEGVARRTPSTNNALEAFHGRLKSEETFRERLPLNRFLALMIECAEKWSFNYCKNINTYASAVSVTLRLWTDGYNWARCATKVQTEGSGRYFCPAGGSKSVSKGDIAAVKDLDWSTFDEFKDRAFKVWIVDLTSEDWVNGRCTCPSYFKQYLCKHVVGLAIRLKFAKPPLAAKQIPLGEKRKRGRPRKATSANVRD